MYSISTLRSFISALSDNFLYVTCTLGFPLGGLDSCIIWAIPPSFRPSDYPIKSWSKKRGFLCSGRPSSSGFSA